MAEGSSGSTPRIVRLIRNGHDPVDMSLTQITPATVCRVFSVDPQLVWLKEDFGNRAFFPGPGNMEFDFTHEVGDTPVNARQNPNRMANMSPVPVTVPLVSPTNTPGPIVFNSGKSKSYNVRVAKGSVGYTSTGKVKLHNANDQIFVDITEETANVHYILNFVKKKWGESYILCTSDGLPIEDSSGTQGFKFWKISARKIFAIPNKELPSSSKRKGKHAIEISDDDCFDSEDDFVQVKPKKGCPPSVSSQITKLQSQFQEINEQLQCVFKLSKTTRIPPGLFRLIHDTFRCSICKCTPLRPPAIYTRCCKSILGCQQCVDQWFGNNGSNKSCPMCRCERAYAETSQLKGMDEFLIGVRPLLDQEDNIDLD